MRVKITTDCISCGECVETCPEVFEMGSDYAEVKTEEVPLEYEDLVRQTAQDCPVSAIIVTED